MPNPAYLAPILGANNLGATQPNKLDFAPSFGFAWSIGNSGKTVIRGGAGLYWDTQPIYDRSSGNGDIGPLGNGRVNISAGAFTNIFPNIVEFSNGKPVPLPIGASLPVLTVSNMTLATILANLQSADRNDFSTSHPANAHDKRPLLGYESQHPQVCGRDLPIPFSTYAGL